MATTTRIPTASEKQKDNTDRIRDNEYIAPDYAATIALLPSKSYTLVNPAALTGAVTFTAGVTVPQIGDRMDFLLVSDGTTRTATFGTGFLPTGTFAVTTAKHATIGFIFNGTGWLETGRAVSA